MSPKLIGPYAALDYLHKRKAPPIWPSPAPWLRPTGAWLRPPKKNILQSLLQSVKHRLS